MGFWGEVKDAIPGRTVLLIVAVLGLQLGFVLSYVGAFHNPSPHQIPMSVVAPAPLRERAVAGLNALAAQPVRAVPAASRAEATRRIRDGTDAAALIVNTLGGADTLLVASAAGVPVSTAVTEVITNAEAGRARADRVLPGHRGRLSVVTWSRPRSAWRRGPGRRRQAARCSGSARWCRTRSCPDWAAC